MSSSTNTHLITLQEAHDLNERYRNNKKAILAAGVDEKILPICETFDRADFDSLFNQQGCTGIRIYLGMKENDDICIVAVGVNNNDEDMVSITSENNIILDRGHRCPAMCPPSSPLNS